MISGFCCVIWVGRLWVCCFVTADLLGCLCLGGFSGVCLVVAYFCLFGGLLFFGCLLVLIVGWCGLAGLVI